MLNRPPSTAPLARIQHVVPHSIFPDSPSLELAGPRWASLTPRQVSATAADPLLFTISVCSTCVLPSNWEGEGVSACTCAIRLVDLDVTWRCLVSVSEYLHLGAHQYRGSCAPISKPHQQLRRSRDMCISLLTTSSENRNYYAVDYLILSK